MRECNATSSRAPEALGARGPCELTGGYRGRTEHPCLVRVVFWAIVTPITLYRGHREGEFSRSLMRDIDFRSSNNGRLKVYCREKTVSSVSPAYATVLVDSRYCSDFGSNISHIFHMPNNSTYIME